MRIHEDSRPKASKASEDNHVHIPIQKQRHVPVHIPVERPMEVNVIETTEKVIDVPVVKQIEVPQVQTIEKVVEVPFAPCFAAISTRFGLRISLFRPFLGGFAPLRATSERWCRGEVQVVEKVVEVPQLGSTTQGSVREVDVETEPTRQET